MYFNRISNSTFVRIGEHLLNLQTAIITGSYLASLREPYYLAEQHAGNTIYFSNEQMMKAPDLAHKIEALKK